MRKSGHHEWGGFARVLVVLVSAVVLYSLALGGSNGPPGERRVGGDGARLWQSVLMVAALLLVPVVLLEFLDRVGLALPGMLRRAVMPGVAERTMRIRHDLHMLAWVIELHRLLGDQATDKWRTPRWPAGVCAVPQTGTGRSRRAVTLKDIKRPKHVGIFDVDSKDIARIEPDAICEIKLLEERLSFDLLIELDLTDRASYNLEKFRRYDAFLTAWWSETRRYQQLGTRPGVLFVCTTEEMALSYARAADGLMRGSIAVTGSAAHERYYPGREHVWFASESDIHEGDLTMLALPSLPPETREALDGTRSLALSRVLLFEERIIRAGQSTGGVPGAI